MLCLGVRNYLPLELCYISHCVNTLRQVKQFRHSVTSLLSMVACIQCNSRSLKPSLKRLNSPMGKRSNCSSRCCQQVPLLFFLSSHRSPRKSSSFLINWIFIIGFQSWNVTGGGGTTCNPSLKLTILWASTPQAIGIAEENLCLCPTPIPFMKPLQGSHI